MTASLPGARLGSMPGGGAPSPLPGDFQHTYFGSRPREQTCKEFGFLYLMVPTIGYDKFFNTFLLIYIYVGLLQN